MHPRNRHLPVRALPARALLTAALAVTVAVALGAILALPAGAQSANPIDPGTRARVLEASMERLGLEEATLQEIPLLAAAPDAFTVRLALGGSPVTVRLERRSLRSKGFRMLVENERGEIVEGVAPPPRTYRGAIEGMPGASAAASLDPRGGIRALVALDEETIYAVQPATDALADAPPSLHVVYRTTDLFPLDDYDCGVLAPPVERSVGTPPPGGGGPEPLGTGLKICEIAFDADREFYQANGSNQQNTIADIENVMNNVTFIYERDTGITYDITAVVVRTSEPDPYSTTDPSGLLTQFRTEWNTNQGSIPRDVAHLMTGKNLDGSVIGIANLSVICAVSSAYGLSQSRFTSNMASRAALTAHELGHNWSAVHCSGNDCRIMCPTLGGCSGDVSQFGAQSKASITAFRDTRGCLSEIETPLALPFLDSFTGQSVDMTIWSANHGTAVADFALNEPTEPYALNLDAVGADPGDQDDLWSKPLLLGGQSNVTLSFFSEARGPSAGESLIVEYWGSNQAWNNLETITGDGSNEDWFRFHHHTLTGNALHDEFRVRFRTDADFPLDDWFVDNVSICAGTVLISMTPQTTTVPAGGQLFFSATVTNATGAGQSSQAWINVTAPDWSPLFAGGNPKFGPKAFSLNPSQSKTKPSLKINVPAGAVPGTGYRVIAAVGDLASGEICSAAEFQFEVTP